MNTTTTLDLTADIIDIRDIIERIEELEEQTAGIRSGSPLSPTEFLKAYRSFHYPKEGYSDSVLAELATLTAIMEELKGNGGDEQWRGDWYPVTLIRDHYFTDYCREFVQDIGDLPKDIPAYIAIDWDATADNLRVDYSSIEITYNDRWVTYWYR